MPGAAGRSGDDLPRIAGFRIIRVIGRGAMGTVYEAYEESMHRTVALKVLDASTALSSRATTRFEREAWIGGRLSHPGVTKVFGHGLDGRSHYLVMEIAGAESLQAEIRRARARRQTVKSDSAWRADHIRRMVSLLADVTDALSHVHKHGVVHRDIKPSNLLLSEDGRRLMITDFGLARDEEASALTRRGDFLGTIRYMSPEQLLAQRVEVDHRSDIWSFGVSLYEAVALDLPYSGDSEEAYIVAVSTSDPIPATARDKAVPRDLETIILKCLERNPDRRYQSAAELKEDLRRFLADEPVLARRPGPVTKALRFARRRRSLVFVSVAATIVVAVVGSCNVRTNRELAMHGRTLARLDEGGRISRYGARIAMARELDQNEARLRDAFLSGGLPAEPRERLARHLLRPLIRIEPYVDRTEYERRYNTIQAQVTQWHWDWGLVAVVQSKIVLDGVVLREKPAFAPLGVLQLLAGEEVRDLSVGQHTLAVELRAWFFEIADVVSPSDDRPDPAEPWNLGVSWGLFAPTQGETALVYGPDAASWEELWPDFRERASSVEVGPLRFPPAKFTVTDGRLPGYPVAIRSDEIDDAMRDAFSLEYCRLVLDATGENDLLEIGLKTVVPAPAPLVSVVELETPWGRCFNAALWFFSDGDTLLEPSQPVFVRQGELTYVEPWVPLSWEELPPEGERRAVPRDPAAIEAIGSVPVRVLLKPPDVDEISWTLGSYWDGVLEFEAEAELVFRE